MKPTDLKKGESFRAVNVTKDATLAESLRLALDPLARLAGLLKGPQLGETEGLLLRPCKGVHSFFMKYSIDVAFLDEEGRIVGIRPNLKPWRITPMFDADCTLELFAGRLAATATQIGDLVVFETVE